MIWRSIKFLARLCVVLAFAMCYSYFELKYSNGGKGTHLLLCCMLYTKSRGIFLPAGMFILFLLLEYKSLEFYCFLLGSLMYIFFDKIDPRTEEDYVELDEWEMRFKEFYREHNPSKLGDVGRIMAKYSGREQELWDSLQKRYISGEQPEASGESAGSTPHPSEVLPVKPSNHQVAIEKSPTRTTYGLEDRPAAAAAAAAAAARPAAVPPPPAAAAAAAASGPRHRPGAGGLAAARAEAANRQQDNIEARIAALKLRRSAPRYIS